MIPFRLLVITDWSRPDCLERVSQLRDLPEVAVQHRHPGASDREFLREGEALRAALGPDFPLFINGRFDLAVALHAHLHLRGDSVSVDAVRPLLPKRWLSASWHEDAAPRAADLLLLSPVNDPSSKPRERPALGAARFDALARTTRTPVFALGGIDVSTAASLQHAAGLAVIGAVLHASAPRAAAAALLKAHRRPVS